VNKIDRFEMSKKREKDKKKFEKLNKKLSDEEAKLLKKISKEIEVNGNEKLKKLWSNYNMNQLMNKFSMATNFLLIHNTGKLMENIMSTFSLECTKCEDTLVQDGMWGEVKDPDNSPMEPFQELKIIKGQFVCLACGKQYRLQEI